MITKKITLSVNSIEFNFNVTTLAYNNYVNEIQQLSKVAPSNNFVKRCIDKNQKEDFEKFINETPGAAIQIAGTLVEQFAPQLEIEIKN